MNPLTTAAICITAAAATIGALSVPESAITGPARIIDGDTLQINSTRIRLWGIDALEKAQTCGTWHCGIAALQKLIDITHGKMVDCEQVDKDKYGRTVARCFVGGKDIAKEMVSSGFALDYTQYSRGYYKQNENEARNAKLGMWSGPFENPAEWRHR